MTDAVILKLDTVLEITSELEEFYVDNLPYVISIAVVIKVLKGGGECKRKGSKFLAIWNLIFFQDLNTHIRQLRTFFTAIYDLVKVLSNNEKMFFLIIKVGFHKFH